jgi:site-specific DNA recombinase
VAIAGARSSVKSRRGRYVYYHCTGSKGKCPERYTRQEVLEERFAQILEGLDFDDEVLTWVAEALRQSHQDERRSHDEAIARLQAEHARLQNRLDSMYLDKLDGRVDAAFFDRKAAEWRSEQHSLVRVIEEHQGANESYLDEGVNLLELAKRAHILFKKQEPREKRRLLDFVVSNCTWKNGELLATYRQPFDLLASTARADREFVAAGTPSEGRFENWLPGQDSNLRPSD